MDKSWQIVVMYILTHLGLIFFLYPANIIESSSEAQWIPIGIGVILHFVIVLIYLKGLSYFQNKNIIDIYSSFGKLWTILLLIPTGLYLLMINIITVRAYSEIINIIFLTKTPLWAIMLLILSISCYLSMQELSAIFKTGFLLSFLFLPLVLFVICISFQNVDWRYAFPMWSSDFSFIKKQSYFNSYFAIGGGFLFLGFIQPVLSFRNSRILIGLAAIVPAFLLSVYVPVLTFGQATAETFIFPYVAAVDGINISWLMFDRITMFFLLCLITFIMLFIALVFWKTVQITKYYIPILSEKWAAIGLAFFIYCICLLIPNWSDAERLFQINTPLRFYVILLVPLSIFGLGFWKKRKEGVNG